MTTTDTDRLRSRIATLGLSQRGLARALGVNERTVRDWASGETDVPAYVWRWLDDAIVSPPAGTTADDDRDDACADALAPHVARLVERARAAGWSDPESLAAIISLAAFEMQLRAGDSATREALKQAISQMDI